MNYGIAVMLHDGSPKNPKDYYGRTITDARRSDEELRLTFADGVTIRIYDAGQSCCENRYMHTADDLKTLVGHKLTGIETNSAKTDGFSSQEEYGEHEAVFLDVKTDDGMISFSFHNEHNGYYGGFALAVDEQVPL